jgi:hypothetical protein
MENRMKLTLPLIGLMIAHAAGPAAAEELLVQGTRSTPAVQVVAKALDACATAVVARLFPGQSVASVSDIAVDDRVAAAAGSADEMVIRIQAQLKSDGSLLAAGDCHVTRRARVVNLSVRMSPSATVAGLKPQDIKVAAARP